MNDTDRLKKFQALGDVEFYPDDVANEDDYASYRTTAPKRIKCTLCHKTIEKNEVVIGVKSGGVLLYHCAPHCN